MAHACPDTWLTPHRIGGSAAQEYSNGYKELPEEVYKRLHIIPETFIVDEHHVHVYASKDNSGKILKASRPVDLFRNSIATPALVASIINGKKTYMWVYRNNPHCSKYPIVLYDWQPSRKADHPREFLKNFSGTVVTDGYQVYHKLGKERQDLQISGCWIHARRPYAEFIKSVGASAAKGSIAKEAYSMITEIMHLDNGIDDLSN